MEQIKHAVGVDADGATGRGRVGLVADGVGELADRGRGHGGLFGVEGQVAVTTAVARGQALARRLAADPLGDVDTGLGGVARLAGVLGLGQVVAHGGRGLVVRVGALSLGWRVAVPGRVLVGGEGPGRLRGGVAALLARGVPRLGLDDGVLVHGGGGGGGVGALSFGARGL